MSDDEKSFRLERNFFSQRRYSHAGVMAASILILCLLLSQVYWKGMEPFSSLLIASGESVFLKGEYWRLFTSVFVHSNFGHLLSNALMFSLMGFFVYSQYGPWVFPFWTLVAGATINAVVLQTMPLEHKLLGISGVVYFLWGYWLFLYICIQRHISLNRRLMKVVAISLLILVPTSYKPNVSYLAHGMGLVFGVFMALVYYLINRDYLHSFEEWVEVEDLDELSDGEI